MWTYRKEGYTRHDAPILRAGELVEEVSRVSGIGRRWLVEADSTDLTLGRHCGLIGPSWRDDVVGEEDGEEGRD